MLFLKKKSDIDDMGYHGINMYEADMLFKKYYVCKIILELNTIVLSIQLYLKDLAYYG